MIYIIDECLIQQGIVGIETEGMETDGMETDVSSICLVYCADFNILVIL